MKPTNESKGEKRQKGKQGQKGDDGTDSVDRRDKQQQVEYISMVCTTGYLTILGRSIPPNPPCGQLTIMTEEQLGWNYNCWHCRFAGTTVAGVVLPLEVPLLAVHEDAAESRVALVIFADDARNLAGSGWSADVSCKI